MSKESVVTTEIERARRDWMSEHLQSYLRSGGARGHIVDLRPIGGHAFTTTHVLGFGDDGMGAWFVALGPGQVLPLLGEDAPALARSVRTAMYPGKERRRGKFAGYRPDWKKAYVRLRAGEKMPEYAQNL